MCKRQFGPHQRHGAEQCGRPILWRHRVSCRTSQRLLRRPEDDRLRLLLVFVACWGKPMRLWLLGCFRMRSRAALRCMRDIGRSLLRRAGRAVCRIWSRKRASGAYI
jgi:hypothetical protein